MKTVTSITIILLFSTYVYAQTEKDGSVVLSEARKLYEDGEPDNIHQMLKPYLKKGLSSKEKKEAYKLIILSYLFDDLKQEATKVLKEYMDRYPEFDTAHNDPNDLKYLYRLKGFDSKIVFSFGAVGGINSSKPNVIESFNTNDQIESIKLVNAEIQPVYGIQINGRIVDHLDFRMDALYNTGKFSFEQVVDADDITFYNETYNHITIPFWIVPYYSYKKHRVYLKLGGGINYTLNSKAQAKRGSISDSFDDIGDKRIAMTSFVGGGLGVSFKIPRGFISVDGSYLNGLNSIVDADQRDFEDILAIEYDYVDDDFKLNNMIFTVSYVFQFYKLKDQKNK